MLADGGLLLPEFISPLGVDGFSTVVCKIYPALSGILSILADEFAKSFALIYHFAKSIPVAIFIWQSTRK